MTVKHWRIKDAYGTFLFWFIDGSHVDRSLLWRYRNYRILFWVNPLDAVSRESYRSPKEWYVQS